jgi:hypothetical protein
LSFSAPASDLLLSDIRKTNRQIFPDDWKGDSFFFPFLCPIPDLFAERDIRSEHRVHDGHCLYNFEYWHIRKTRVLYVIFSSFFFLPYLLRLNLAKNNGSSRTFMAKDIKFDIEARDKLNVHLSYC